MNRVLIVSAEPSTLALEPALRACAGGWQTRFVADGAQAAVAWAAAPYDVVIADLSSGQADALAVLEHVKAERPGTARIVLSAPLPADLLPRVLSVAHQCVSAPCAPDHLWKVVERTCCLNGLMSNQVIRDLLGGLARLPSVPRSYAELSRAMSSEEVSLGEVVAIIEKDTAMAAKILQLINSAYFGRARRISSIPVTVSLLGLERLRALALSTHVFGMVSEAASRACRLEQLQQRAIVTAQLARRFLATCGRAEEGFAAGLLQNVGTLILAVCLEDRYRAVLDEAARRALPVEVVEREQFAVTHAEVGACLLSLWGLPVTIVEAVAFHHEPGGVLHDDTALLDAVHVADAMADAILQRRDDLTVRAPSVDPLLMTRDGMAERIRAWHAMAAEEYGSVRT